MAVILLSGCLRQFKTTFKGAGGWIKQLFELRLKIIQKNQLEKFHFSWDGGCLWTANINWCNLCRLQATASVNEFLFFFVIVVKGCNQYENYKNKEKFWLFNRRLQQLRKAQTQQTQVKRRRNSKLRHLRFFHFVSFFIPSLTTTQRLWNTGRKDGEKRWKTNESTHHLCAG